MVIYQKNYLIVKVKGRVDSFISLLREKDLNSMLAGIRDELQFSLVCSTVVNYYNQVYKRGMPQLNRFLERENTDC